MRWRCLLQVLLAWLCLHLKLLTETKTTQRLIQATQATTQTTKDIGATHLEQKFETTDGHTIGQCQQVNTFTI